MYYVNFIYLLKIKKYSYPQDKIKDFIYTRFYAILDNKYLGDINGFGDKKAKTLELLYVSGAHVLLQRVTS